MIFSKLYKRKIWMRESHQMNGNNETTSLIKGEKNYDIIMEQLFIIIFLQKDNHQRPSLLRVLPHLQKIF